MTPMPMLGARPLDHADREDGQIWLEDDLSEAGPAKKLAVTHPPGALQPAMRGEEPPPPPPPPQPPGTCSLDVVLDQLGMLAKGQAGAYKREVLRAAPRKPAPPAAAPARPQAGGGDFAQRAAAAAAAALASGEAWMDDEDFKRTNRLRSAAGLSFLLSL